MALRPLCPELAEKAKNEIHEDPKRTEADIQHIKDWLSKQPHLRARTDDQWLLAFLRGCKYSLERTKEKLDLYYSLRSIAPEIFKVTPSNPLFKEVTDLGSYLILPQVEKPDSPRIALIRPGTYDPDKYDFLTIFSPGTLLQKILIYEDDAIIVSGLQTVLDLEGVTMGHLFQLTPSIMKKMAVFYQDALPIRMKGIHYINTPPGFETIFNAIKILLNEKNRNRLYVHNKNYDELYKHVPQEVLPAEYGGKAGSLDDIKGYWKNKIEEYASWLEEDLKYGTDESKRPGKPKTSATLFGLYIYNNNYEDMYKFIPKEALPVEYGGNAGTIQEIADTWKAKRQEYSSWLEEDLQYCTDESKRPGKPKTSESLFGIDGSFRKLEFD